jgi:hypothetical protein
VSEPSSPAGGAAGTPGREPPEPVPEEAIAPPDQPGARGRPDAEESDDAPLPGELEPMAPPREPTGDGLLVDPAGPGA